MRRPFCDPGGAVSGRMTECLGPSVMRVIQTTLATISSMWLLLETPHMQILGLLGKTDKQGGLVREKKGDGGEGRGDVLDWRMFWESWCNYWVSFQCDRAHDKNDNNARPPSEFSECAPLFMLMTQLPMLGWLCSQAWNKLRGGCRQHFHCIPPVAVPITTASPILSPPTADQMLMAHAALRWLTIISLASTAHINRVTVGTGRLKCY